jgi:hypothetical protein
MLNPLKTLINLDKLYLYFFTCLYLIPYISLGIILLVYGVTYYE